MTTWAETQAASPEDPTAGTHASGESQAADKLRGSDLQALKAEVPSAVAALRRTCARLVANDQDTYLRFNAFSCYMSLLQLAVGVSDKINLETTGALDVQES